MKKESVIPTKSCDEAERYFPDQCCGLTEAQVLLRQEEKLTNKTPNKYSKTYFSIIKDNLFTFFNLLGLIVCISLIVIGASINRFLFVIIYVANILIGIIQEIRAKKCIDRLSLMASKTVTVIRNGQKSDILSQDLVLDDVYTLAPGDQVPTDSIILDGEVEVNEALLTGESIAVKKSVGDALYAGSFIISGKTTLRADKVGKENYVEILSAKAKKYKKPHSELLSSLQIVIRTVGAIVVPISLTFILKSLIFYNIPAFDIIDGASTVVIGLIPSGMFLLTSMALAVGVIKLAKYNTLVQDLYSLEMLARIDTICFDKTGTLTDGRMNVSEVIDLEESDIPVNTIMSVLLPHLESNNQTEIALREYFGQSNDYAVKTTVQFNSSRKFSCATFENDKTYAFGAPEFLLNKEEYEKIAHKISQYAVLGIRVLAVAVSNSAIDGENIPNDFKPVALITLSDNVREDAIKTIAWFKENGVSVKVISGDNPITVSTISKLAGVEGAEKYISLEGLSETEIIEIANEYTVFGRVTPEQKAILIKAIKTAGHVTAMTGDGVNDILALKEADCAISVGSGSQAAKNISHIVLMDNNFDSMPKIVFEGRRVINNVQGSSALYLMKTMFTMFFSILTLCLPTVPAYPFSLSQMMLMELFIIGIPSFFLSLQPNDEKVKGKFIVGMLNKALPSAILMVLSVSLVELSKTILGVGGTITNETYSTMNVIALNYSALICLYDICKPYNKGKVILYSVIFSIITGIFVYAIFEGLPMFELYPMAPLLPDNWHHVLIVLCIVLLNIPVYMLLKRGFSKIHFNFKFINKNK